MKQCQLCGTVDEADAPTCPSCGEATWTPLEQPAVEQTEDAVKTPKRKSSR